MGRLSPTTLADTVSTNLARGDDFFACDSIVFPWTNQDATSIFMTVIVAIIGLPPGSL
jgi:hypothetical protein